MAAASGAVYVNIVNSQRMLAVLKGLKLVKLHQL